MTETIKSLLMKNEVNGVTNRENLARRILERKKDQGSPQGPAVDLDIALCTAIGIFDIVPEVDYTNKFIKAHSI